MKKIFIIFLFLLTGCSSNILKCSKTNYSTIYGSEIENETYVFKNDKLIEYTSIRKITFDDNMIKYIDELFEFREKELEIIKENIKGSATYIKKENDNILYKINIDINLSDSTLEKINIDKNTSVTYLRKNLIEKGYICELE